MQAIVRALTTVWHAWKTLGKFIGDIVGRVFLMLFYVTIALPFGLGVRLFGDPLDVKDNSKAPAWIERNSLEATLEVGHQQF